MRLRASFVRAGRWAVLASLITAGSTAACAHEFDTTRRAPAKLTLGDDLFQVLCDRVAATADPFDLEGRRSREVCHPNEAGVYADSYYDEDGPMPPKVAVMVRYRSKLIEAFNATIPDDGTLHGDLKDLLSALVPLYDDDTLPESTRTLAAVLDAIAFGSKSDPKGGDKSDPPSQDPAKAQRAADARAALARLGGRKGYRTIPTAIGIARPLLAYPELGDLVDQTLRVLGPGGSAEPELRKVLEVAQAKLASATIAEARAPIATYADRFSGVRGQLPKRTSEILRNLLVDPPPLKADLSGPAYPATWRDAFAGDENAAVLPFVVRDRRGWAAFATKPQGAADSDGDGLVDVDDLGRFLSAAGGPLAVATPFTFVTSSGVEGSADPRDELGRALVAPGGTPLYAYGDASRSLLRALLRDTEVLADPKNGALLDLAHGAARQIGPRVDGKVAEYVDPLGGAKLTVRYRGIDTSASPYVDLAYAVGRILELPRLADDLELVRVLVRDHAPALARVTGAALQIAEIAKKPEYASVDLDDKSALWDDLAGVLAEISREPEVLKDLLDALAEPDALLMPRALSAFVANKDAIDYDPAADLCDPSKDCPALNRPYYNVTLGAAGKPPQTPVDRAAADAEDNRSLFQRFLSLIHDSSGVRACNKDKARIKTTFLNITLPIGGGSYDECEVLNIPDLAVFYLGCIEGGTDEVTRDPRCKLPLTNGFISALRGILGSGTLDGILEDSSNITGLKQVPTIEALNRLVFWRKPNEFVQAFVDPIPTSVCPIPAGSTRGTRKCSNPQDLLMNRQRATIFMGETLDGLRALRPLIRPFVKKRADGKGREQYFIQLVKILHRHWSPGGNATRCQDGGTPESNPRFCTKSNVRAYEGIAAEALASDLIPALAETTKLLKTIRINGKSGTDVAAALVRDLFDPQISKGLALVDRKGNAGTTTNDGRPVDQVTPFYLFANALAKLEASWAGADADKAVFRAARSKLVDQFLAVDTPGGDVTKSSFRNQAARAAIPIFLDLIEDRIAEHRAKGDFEAWARGGLAKDFEEVVGGPVAAAVLDLHEKIWADQAARSALGKVVVYLANQASANDALANVITATQDVLQVVSDDANLVPIFRALSTLAAPDGATKRGLDLVERIGAIERGEAFAGAHGGRRPITKLLGNAVTPIGTTQVTPLEVFVDVIADLHRADPTQNGAYGPADYGSVARNVQEFLVDPTRGLEQFYAIVKNRNE